MKTIKSSSENEIKIVNQLMTALNFLYVLPNDEELGNFTVQAIKNIPEVDHCCLCLRGLKTVIGDSQKDAENIMDLINNTPPDVNEITLAPIINKNLEVLKLQTSDRKYGYLLFSLPASTDFNWIKPIVSNFINLVALELERRWQKRELIKHSKILNQKIKKRTAHLDNEIKKRIKTENSLRNSQNLLAKSQELAKIGSWSLNLTTNRLRWTDEVYRIFGFEPKEFTPSYEAFLHAIHPDDRTRVDKVYSNSIKEGKDSYEIEHRIINQKTGETCFVFEKCIHQKDTTGRIIKSAGTIHDITDRKQKEILLQESEKKFKDLFEKSSDALLIIKNDIFIDCNDATVKMLGYPAKDVFLNVHPSELSPEVQPDGENSWKKAQEMMRLAFENGSHHFEWIHTKKNKKDFPVEVLLTAISNKPNNKVIHCVWRDITSRKEAEINLIRSNKIINSSPVVTFQWGTDILWNTKFVSKNVIDLLGYNAEEFLQNKISFKNLIHPEDFDKIEKELHKYYKSKHEKKLVQEYRVITKNGNIKWLRDFPSIEKDNNDNIINFIGVLQDITEKKQAETELIELKNQYKNLLDTLPQFIYHLDTDLKFISANKTYCDAYSLKESEIIGKTSLDIFPKDLAKKCMDSDGGVILKGNIQEYDDAINIAIKGIDMVHIIKIPVKDSDGNITGMLGMYWDITKLKKAEEELLANLRHLDNAQNIAKLGYSERNLSTGEGYWSNGLFKIIGFKPNKKDQTFQKLFDLVHSDYKSILKEKYQELIQSEGTLDVELKYHRNNGEIGWIHIVSETKLNPIGELIQYTVFNDITGRKNTEETLKISEIKLKEALSITNLGTYIFDDSKDLFETSQICNEIIGIDASYTKDIQGWINLVHPDDYEKVQQLFDNTNLKDVSTELRIIRPNDNKIIWIHSHAKKEYDIKGIRTKITGTIQDITRRIEAKEKLRQSEERWQFAIDGSNLGLWDWNLETNDVFFSPQWKKMLGFEEDDSFRKIEDWDRLVHPDDKKKSYKVIQDHLNGKTPYYINESRKRCKDNTYKWFLGRGKVISFSEDGKPIRMIGTQTDITKQKEAVENIKKYSNLVKDSFNEVYLFDTVSLKFIDANHAALSNLGYTHEELLKLTPVDIKPKFTLNSFKKAIKPLIDKKEKQILFYTDHQRKDGTVYPVEVHLQLTKYNEGEFFSAFILDITDRKKTEQALLKSEEQLSIMFKEAPLGIALVDSLKGTIYKSNKEFENITGRSELEMNQTSWMKITHPDDLQEDLENMKLLNSEKIAGYKMNKRYIQPDGTIVWINMTVSPLEVKDKAHPKHLCMIEDITENKIAELKFLNSQHHLETAQTIAKLGYFETNITTNTTTWSDGMFKILGYTPIELEPSVDNFHKLVHPEDLEDLIINQQNANKFQGEIKNEFRLFDKSGQLKWMLFSGETKKTENGEIIIKGIIQDNTIRKEAEDMILREKELLKAIIDKIPVMLAHYTPDDKMLNLNAEMEKIIGWKTEEVQDIDLLEKVYPNPEYHKKAVEFMKKANSEWKEFKVQSKSGKIIESEWSNMELSDGTRIGIGIDISERKKSEMKITKYQNHLEDIVNERTKELEVKSEKLAKQNIDLLKQKILYKEANNELEAFSYSVSHDLRAPLRHIDGFTKLLNNNIKNIIDEKSQQYFDHIVNSTCQMNTLIDDLLIFSRTSRKDIRKSKINMNVVVDEAIQSLDSDIKENNVSITISKLPDANVDPSLFVQVWLNLIANAIKFTSKSKNQKIEIGSEKDSKGNDTFFIKDNGVGFDQKFTGMLFKVFQRLHNNSEFPGTGIGLASVKRIINKHGGSVWAEGKVNKGASFFFKLTDD